MYREYLESELGLVEINCDENYLKSVYIVKKRQDENKSELTTLVKKQLQEYFEHKRTQFDIPMNLTNNFKDRVYQALLDHDYATTLSYKELATKIDSKAYQAVGTAMATNPYFIVVP